ncbi:MAG: inositol monophosphatase family protein [Pirellulales bacterium]
MVEFSEVAERAARAGGQVLLEWIGRFNVREKGPSDLVTDADLASQKVICEVLHAAFPSHDVLGEEDKVAAPRTSPYRWIIDPLDGTTNYVHRVPHFCVSIALEHEGKLLTGCIYDPSSRECYTASSGRGEYLNGKRIQAATTASLSQSLIAAGFPAKVNPESREIRDLNKLIVAGQAIRRTGSAALNLCYVACGRFDAYWARRNQGLGRRRRGAVDPRSGRRRHGFRRSSRRYGTTAFTRRRHAGLTQGTVRFGRRPLNRVRIVVEFVRITSASFRHKRRHRYAA